MNFSPGGGTRPSTVIGPHAIIWLSGSAETPPGGGHARQAPRAAPRAAGRLRAPPAASAYLRPVIVSSSVSTPAGLKPGGTSLQVREAADQQPGADEQHTESASSATTSRRRRLPAARPQTRRAPAAPRPASLSVVVQIDARPAAAPAPGRTARPASTRQRSVKAARRRRCAISCRRGTLAAPSARMPSRLQAANTQARARRRRARAARSRSAAGGRCGRGWRRAPRGRRSPSAARARATAAGWRRSRRRSAARSRPAPISTISGRPHVADDLLLQRHDAERQPAVRRVERPDGRGAAAR